MSTTTTPPPNDSEIKRPKWPKEEAIPDYFGRITLGNDGMPTERWERERLTTISTPYPLRLSWDLDTKVSRIRCALAVAQDLQAIFEDIFRHYDHDVSKVQAARMDIYGGCYNFRRKRGLAGLSTHAYGIAIDLDPDRNGLGVKWEKDKGMMPEAIVEIFERHGWTWGGRWKNRPDPMHFQATS